MPNDPRSNSSEFCAQTEVSASLAGDRLRIGKISGYLTREPHWLAENWLSGADRGLIPNESKGA
jgi:hypothetical protein